MRDRWGVPSRSDEPPDEDPQCRKCDRAMVQDWDGTWYCNCGQDEEPEEVEEEEEDNSPMLGLAISMYVIEPCRICGEIITQDCLNRREIVFAGYSSDDSTRAAHKMCWDKNIPAGKWKIQ